MPEWKMLSGDQKCKALEEAIRETAQAHQLVKNEGQAEGDEVGEEVKEWILERKKFKGEKDDQIDKEKVKKLSKEIQSGIRKSIRHKKRARIGKMLAEFRGLRHIADIRNNQTKRRLQSVHDIRGELQEGRQEIVDAFADFYAQLYHGARENREDQQEYHGRNRELPPMKQERWRSS